MKSIVYFFFDKIFFLLGIHGELGCEDHLVPCLNSTHCIKLEQVCVDFPDCVDGKGQKICSYQ